MNIIAFLKNLSETKKIIIIASALVVLLIPMSLLIFSKVDQKDTGIGGNNNLPSPTQQILPTAFPSGIKPSPLLSLAPSSYVPDELIVKYKSGKTFDEITDIDEKKKMEDVFNRAGVMSQKKMYTDSSSTLKNYYIFQLRQGVNIINSINLINGLDEIEYVQPNFIQRTF